MGEEDDPPAIRRAHRAKRRGVTITRIDGGAIAGGLAVMLFAFGLSLWFGSSVGFSLLLVGLGILAGGYTTGRFHNEERASCPACHGLLAALSLLCVVLVFWMASVLADTTVTDQPVFAMWGTDVRYDLGTLVVVGFLALAGTTIGRKP